MICLLFLHISNTRSRLVDKNNYNSKKIKKKPKFKVGTSCILVSLSYFYFSSEKDHVTAQLLMLVITHSIDDIYICLICFFLRNISLICLMKTEHHNHHARVLVAYSVQGNWDAG